MYSRVPHIQAAGHDQALKADSHRKAISVGVLRREDNFITKLLPLAITGDR